MSKLTPSISQAGFFSDLRFDLDESSRLTPLWWHFPQRAVKAAVSSQNHPHPVNPQQLHSQVREVES